MARGTRLDAPGAVHHVIARGIERRPIFRDDRDRRAYLDRLEAAIDGTGTVLFAWALMTNHVHFVMRTGIRPLAHTMQRLGTRYVRYFNARYLRTGTLFQGRYKSVLVDEESYLLPLIRYVHRNPLEAGLVSSLAELRRYPWTGHAVLMGHQAAPFQAVDPILRRFGARSEEARRHLTAWMADSQEVGPPLEPSVSSLPRTCHDPVLLRGAPLHPRAGLAGSHAFAEEALCELRETAIGRRLRATEWSAPRLVEFVCQILGADPDAVRAGRRSRPESRARAAIAYLAHGELALPCTQLARHLGVSHAALSKSIPRGARIVREAGISIGES